MSGKEKGISKDEFESLNDLLLELEDHELSNDFREPVDYIKFDLKNYPEIIKNPMDLSTVNKKLNNSKYYSVQEVLNDIQLIWENCKIYNCEKSIIYKHAVKLEKFSKRLIEKLFKTKTTNVTEEKKVKRGRGNWRTKSNSQVENEVKEENGNLNTNNNNMNIVFEETKNIEIKEKINNEESSKKISSSSEKNLNQFNAINPLKPFDDEDNPNDSIIISLLEREKLAERVKRLANDGLASLVRLIQKDCPACIEDVDDERLMIKITDMDRKTYEQINQLIDTFLRVRETNQENLEMKRVKEKSKEF